MPVWHLNHAAVSRLRALAASFLLITAAPLPALANQSATASASPPPAASSVGADAYLLGPGDQLDLRLFDAPELSGPLDVLNDGTVQLPLAGSVRVSGLTLQQATVWFRSLLGEQLLRPELQLRVLRPRPIRVSLIGEVERPGLYSLTSNETSVIEGAPGIRLSGLPTVVDAIQKAGGITQNANLRKVILQRRLPGDRPTYKQASLDLLALVLDGDQVQNPYLFDGDTVQITRVSVPSSESIELAAVNLSPQVIAVNVIGEVVSPGKLQLMANTPLIQAVLAAGGPKNWRANTGNVELVRINRNGSATLRKFKIKLDQGASNAKNPPLRDGDIVRVNRNALAVGSDALGAVSQPLSSLVTIWSLLQLVSR